MSMHQIDCNVMSMSHDCNDDCNNYKFISHQIGQYPPKIFAGTGPNTNKNHTRLPHTEGISHRVTKTQRNDVKVSPISNPDVKVHCFLWKGPRQPCSKCFSVVDLSWIVKSENLSWGRRVEKKREDDRGSTSRQATFHSRRNG